MKSDKLVVHVTPTPLVGAPSRIVTALNQHSEFTAVNVVLKDYPGALKGKFLVNCINVDDDKKTRESAIDLLSIADVVHIHNFLPMDWADILRRVYSRQIFVYHVHSPLKEGPTYFDWSACLPIRPSARLVISQWPQRLFHDFRFVPNIVPEEATVRYVDDDALPTVMFSPSHRRMSRWGSKSFEGIDEQLLSLHNSKAAAVKIFEGIEQQTLLALRRRAQVSIDDVATGGFHQVSLEAMVAGNVVLNGAEDSNIHALRSLLQVDDIPFIRVNKGSFLPTLRDLVTDRPRLRAEQKRVHDFVRDHMHPRQLVQHFADVYRGLLA